MTGAVITASAHFQFVSRALFECIDKKFSNDLTWRVVTVTSRRILCAPPIRRMGFHRSGVVEKMHDITGSIHEPDADADADSVVHQ
jgi:hypothetical protein